MCFIHRILKVYKDWCFSTLMTVILFCFTFMIAFYFDDLQRWIYIHHHDVYLMKLFQSYFCIVLFCFMRVFLSNLVFNYYCYYYYYYILWGIGFHSFIHLIFTFICLLLCKGL